MDLRDFGQKCDFYRNFKFSYSLPHGTCSRNLFLCPWDQIRRMSSGSGCSFWREIIFSEFLTIFIGQWLIF